MAHFVALAIPVQSVSPSQPQVKGVAPAGLQSWPVLSVEQFESIAHSTQVLLPVSQRVAPAMPVQSVSPSQPHVLAGAPAGLQSWPVLSAEQWPSLSHSTHALLFAPLVAQCGGRPAQVVASLAAEQPQVSVVDRHPLPAVLAEQWVFAAGNAPLDWAHCTHVSSNPLNACSHLGVAGDPEHWPSAVHTTQSLICGLPAVSSHCPVEHWVPVVHEVLQRLAGPVHA